MFCSRSSRFLLIDSADEWYVNSLFHLCSVDPGKDISWRCLFHCISLITKTTGTLPAFMYRAKLTVWENSAMREATATRNTQSMSVFNSVNFAIHLSNAKIPFQVSQNLSCGHEKTFRLHKLNVASKPTLRFRRDNFPSAFQCGRVFSCIESTMLLHQSKLYWA